MVTAIIIRLKTTHSFFKQGDFVMQLVNREGCANGDVGQVVECSATGLKVKYVDATVTYALQI